MTTKAGPDDGPVHVDQRGSVGSIRLNRPAALNSLTLEMVRTIAGALDRFEADHTVATILVTGAGDRAFCAGGDIRALYESLPRTELAEAFWREEYVLNARIATLRKPYVALMDGITMGGGIGVSAHGSHRVVTERSRLAMPECGIGFFPDIGATWLLTRAPGEVGTWLGLTGQVIGADDAILARLADVQVASARLGDLVSTLEVLPSGAGLADVSAVLARFAEPATAAPVAEDRADIDRAFAGDTIEAILANLQACGTAFALKTHADLMSKSPTSLKLTLRLLRLARSSTGLRQCLEREFAACHAIIGKHDFREGIRAAVIDKDRKPRWEPARLDQVRDEDIGVYFRPAPRPLFPQRHA